MITTAMDEIIEKKLKEVIIHCKVGMIEELTTEQIEKNKNLGLAVEEEYIWVAGTIDIRDISSVTESTKNGEVVEDQCLILFKSGANWIILEPYAKIREIWLGWIIKTL